MDSIDRALLVLLQHDATKTNLDLANAVGLAPSSCLRRIQRLKKAGWIDRVVAILNPVIAGRTIRLIITVKLMLKDGPKLQHFLDLASDDQAVVQAYGVTGSEDVVLFLRLRDMTEYDDFCNRLLTENQNVSSHLAMVVSHTAKEGTAIPI